MAKLIRFTTLDGPKVHINPDHVVMVSSDEGNPSKGAIIRLSAPAGLSDGQARYSLYLQDTAAKVVEAIEDHYAGLPPRS